MPDIQQLFSRVFRFAFSLTRNRESAEDIAQESMLRALQTGLVENEHSEQKQCDIARKRMVAWLFKVARNVWLDKIKSADQRKRIESDVMETGFELELDRLELNDEVHQAMKTMLLLPETQRQVLFLRAVEEMSINEIANSLEMSQGAVKTNLSLARKRMRELNLSIRSQDR